MDPRRDKLRKVKTSGTFKRKIKQNFLSIYNSDLTTTHQLKTFKKPQHQLDDTDRTVPPPVEPLGAVGSFEPKVSEEPVKLDNPVAEHNEFVFHQFRDNQHYEEHNSQGVDDCASSFENEEHDFLCEENEMLNNVRLLTALRTWAVTFNIKHNALKELLSILNIRLSNVLPRDPRTLVKTPQSVSIQNIAGGQYWHHGLKSCIEKVCSDISEPVSVSLKINIDGLPIYRSSKDEFWPILFSIHEMPQIRPMIIGIYSGKHKPSDVVQFLSPFVDEMENVYKDGIIINGHKMSVSIRCFICDSPARAFVKGTYNYYLNV